MSDRRAESPAAAPETEADASLRRQLLRHYLQTADAKVARIRACVAAVCVGSTSPADRARPHQALVSALHTLAGNAGTYGFKSISRRARQLELMARAAGETREPAESLQRALEDFVGELEQAFAAARAALD